MAITARQLEVALDSEDTGHEYKVIRHVPGATATDDHWYIQAVVGPNVGKACWCSSTTSDSAALQAAAVLTDLTRAGPT